MDNVRLRQIVATQLQNVRKTKLAKTVFPTKSVAGCSNQPHDETSSPESAGGSASHNTLNKNSFPENYVEKSKPFDWDDVELKPGSNKIFFRLYIAKNVCLMLISVVIVSFTLVHIHKLESLPAKFNCKIVHFAQNYICVVLSKDTRRVVYICFVISSLTMAIVSYSLFVWTLNNITYDVDLFLSFVEHSSQMKIRNALGQCVEKANSGGDFKLFLQKCCVDAYNVGDQDFFEFCIKRCRLSAEECLQEIITDKSDQNLKFDLFFRELFPKFKEWDCRFNF